MSPCRRPRRAAGPRLSLSIELEPGRPDTLAARLLMVVLGELRDDGVEFDRVHLELINDEPLLD